MLWSRYPLLTGDFEVTMTFATTKPPAKTTSGDGFAFWYVYENATAAQEKLATEHVHNQEELIANTWDVAMRAGGFELLGYRSAFEGLGVFFCDDSSGKPTVSALVGDGKKQITLGADVPPSDPAAFKIINRDSPKTVKVRVQKTGIVVEVVGGEIIELKQELRPGGYLGFSIFGGRRGAVDPKEKSDVVELQLLEVVNMDSAAEGENIPKASDAVAAPTSAGDKEDVLAQSSSFRDHRAESEAIKELTDMVFKLVQETQPIRGEIGKLIESLADRVVVMENNFAQLKGALDKKTGHHLGKEFESIKMELTKLSSVATSETKKTHSQLENLHKDIAHVHKKAHSDDPADDHLSRLATANQRTIDQMTNEHQKMFGVSIAAIAFVVIAGLSLYNKLRCWEKKHSL